MQSVDSIESADGTGTSDFKVRKQNGRTGNKESGARQFVTGLDAPGCTLEHQRANANDRNSSNCALLRDYPSSCSIFFISKDDHPVPQK
jgi:hypothetical protein